MQNYKKIYEVLLGKSDFLMTCWAMDLKRDSWEIKTREREVNKPGSSDMRHVTSWNLNLGKKNGADDYD